MRLKEIKSIESYKNDVTFAGSKFSEIVAGIYTDDSLGNMIEATVRITKGLCYSFTLENASYGSVMTRIIAGAGVIVYEVRKLNLNATKFKMKEYKTLNRYAKSLAEEFISYEDIIKISNEMIERMMAIRDREENAVESVNVPEDDGSNDDDYDEEELTIDYNFDEEEEDDEDELIDPPEKVNVEKKETIKFEVGKTYSYMCNNGVSKYASMLKVVKRTKKNIMFIDVDPDFETDEEDVMKYKIEDLEIHNWKFVSMTCTAYLPAPTEAMYFSDGEGYLGTVYASDVVKDVEESKTDAASVDEVKVEETETDAEIAAMKKEVERKKRLVEYKTTVTFPQRLKRFSEQLINLYAQIAEVENEMWDYQLYAEELTKEYEGEIAALEAEIFNRKMIEAQEYINVSEEAFNISVQAEIDAANNVKAIENLMQAAMSTAITEVEPVSFAIERFNEGEVETAAAVVDTSITSVAEVPIVDEDDMKLKKLNAEIEEIEAQRKALENKMTEKISEQIRMRRIIEYWAYELFPEHVSIKIKTQNEDVVMIVKEDLKFTISSDGTSKIKTRDKLSATYSSIKNFKAAIKGLVAAIERGDEEFAFPADDAA